MVAIVSIGASAVDFAFEFHPKSARDVLNTWRDWSQRF
jgi:hypothetical protein